MKINILLIILFFGMSVKAHNLLTNWSFENGNFQYSISGTASIQGTNAHTGSASLMVSGQGGAEYYLAGLQPKTTYRLTGWAKSNNGASIWIGVKHYGGNESSFATTSAIYTEGELTFTTGVSHTSAIIYTRSLSANGFIDDLSVTYYSASPYQLVWSDEFNVDGGVSSSDWQFEQGFVRNKELQWYQEENAWINNGNLVVEGRRETIPNPNYNAGSSNWKENREYAYYSSSSINTGGGLHSWQYGRFEIRAKVTNLKGTWPAIWTLGVDCQWPSRGEIDIMENYGGDILANFAWGTNKQWAGRWDGSHTAVSSLEPNWVDQYHIWQLVWEEDRMTIYMDDVFLNDVDLEDTINGSFNCAGQNPFQQPHYLLLNLAIGGGAGGDPSGTAFPNQYLVDYVRVWQKDNTLSVNSNTASNELKLYPNPTQDYFTIAGLNENSLIKIYDVYQNLIQNITTTSSNIKINLSNYATGVYFVFIKDQQGNIYQTKKMVKF